MPLWPAGRDLNPRSSESESDALSSYATGGKIYESAEKRRFRTLCDTALLCLKLRLNLFEEQVCRLALCQINCAGGGAGVPASS